jgi:hypothetical protein
MRVFSDGIESIRIGTDRRHSFRRVWDGGSEKRSEQLGKNPDHKLGGHVPISMARPKKTPRLGGVKTLFSVGGVDPKRSRQPLVLCDMSPFCRTVTTHLYGASDILGVPSHGSAHHVSNRPAWFRYFRVQRYPDSCHRGPNTPPSSFSMQRSC